MSYAVMDLGRPMPVGNFPTLLFLGIYIYSSSAMHDSVRVAFECPGFESQLYSVYRPW